MLSGGDHAEVEFYNSQGAYLGKTILRELVFYGTDIKRFVISADLQRDIRIDDIKMGY
jgi:hypothetical protein